MEKPEEKTESHHTPGTIVLVAIFMLVFVVLYIANWVLLSGKWAVH